MSCYYRIRVLEAYSGTCKTFKMKRVVRMFNGFFVIFAKHRILDIFDRVLSAPLNLKVSNEKNNLPYLWTKKVFLQLRHTSLASLPNQQ